MSHVQHRHSLVLAASMCLFGCANGEQYRRLETPTGHECAPETSADKCSFVLQERDTSRPSTLVVVEFDDQGVMHDPRQLNAALSLLRNDPRHIVVTFAHGWFHDARPEDENLRFFRDVLALLSAQEQAAAGAQRRDARHVFGVFLSWRGNATYDWLGKYFTFWNRKDAAHRIGERQATGALVALRKASLHPDGQLRGYPNRFVIIGHSFGGALVHSALSQLTVQSFLDQHEPVADAIILINPAFEAARWHALLDAASSGEHLRPHLAVLTSKTDSATGTAFPLGRWFTSAFQRYREIDNTLRPSVPVDEAESNVSAVGHFAPYITHDLKVQEHADCAHAERPEDLGGTDATTERAYRTESSVVAFGKTCLVPRTDLETEKLGVLNISMDQDVWDGHSFEQDEARRDLALSFLGAFVPFAAASPNAEVLIDGAEAAPPPQPETKSAHETPPAGKAYAF